MKKFKRIMALVIALAMVLTMMSMAAFADITYTKCNVGDTFDPNATYYFLVAGEYQVAQIDNAQSFANAIAQGDNVYKGVDDSGSTPDDTPTPTTGSITIENSSDTTVDASQRKFKAYRILDATELFGDGNDEPATGYAYTIPKAADGGVNTALRTALANKFITVEADRAQKAGETDAAYEQRIIKAIEDAGKADVEQTAKDLLAIAKQGNNVAVYGGDNGFAGGTALSDLPFGYYVIEDVTSPAEDSVSAVMLDTNNPDVTIKVKATKPSVDKEIDGDNDTDDETEGDVKNDTAAIGDEVPFKVTSKVPEMTGYTKYFFIVNDTLSDGLTLNDGGTAADNGFVITIGNDADEENNIPASNPAKKTLVRDFSEDHNTENTDYYVVKDGQSFKIVFKNFLQYRGTQDANDPNVYNNSREGQDILITYSATVNSSAVVGTAGNDNTVTITFSNNPNTVPDNDNDTDEPSDDDVTGDTPESKTKTFVTGIELLKVNKDKDPLAGATFKIEGSKLNQIKETTYKEYVKIDEDSELPESQTIDDVTVSWLNGKGYTFYLLNDGTYTSTAPTNQTSTAYADQKPLYKEVTGSTVAKVEEQDISYVMTTGADGKLTLSGLNAGTYTITELIAPTGYNLLKAPITIEVTGTPSSYENVVDGTNTTFTWTIKKDGEEITDSNSNNLYDFEVENLTGTELPSTGGIGTTIFYVVGAILVIGAGVILITRRRMDA